jgi:hypothetical protein
MNDQHTLSELRKILFKELGGELSYEEKKAFLAERIDARVILNLHEKYLRRKKIVSVAIVLYGIYLALLLFIILVNSERLILTLLIIFAIILIPLLVFAIFDKTVLGYQKFDLVLRIMTRFYVKKTE